jgi:hypothetical protein
MPFTIRPFFRFPVQCTAKHNSGTCLNRLLGLNTVIRGVDVWANEETAVIELLRTRPERNVER